MSKTVDERIVSMQFDNKHFESNVQTTMSTLDKLKAKLRLDGASKGLEEVNSASKKIDMSGLSNAVETVSTRFSALEVMGVTAIANLTNSAVNAGKRIVSALTIDPIKTGLKEYETQINAVQTILANTQSKGTTLDDVNSALDELNTYADKTIYNFTEMTRNIGTFTAAGVDLDTSVSAIQGIANLAAVSGSTSQQASTAMYQLSQALAAGSVKLMDWNSVVNAGMGGQVFQDALKRTATVMGTDVEAIIAAKGSFRESLQEGWITADVLTETLNQFTLATDGSKEKWEEYKKSLKEKGYTDEQAEEILNMANTATDAATKVKTLSQLYDTLKETAQSGWTQTWELIFGDFEEAKSLFSDLYNKISPIIESLSTVRNEILGKALGDSKWDDFTKTIEESGVAIGDFQEKLMETARENGIGIDDLITKYGSLKKVISSGEISTNIFVKTLEKFAESGESTNKVTEDMTDKLTYFQKVVDEIWKDGAWKNSQERIEALTAAGYDYNKVQDLVNKTEDGHRLTLEDLNKETGKAVGLTDEQVKTLSELAKQADDTNTPLGELIESLQKPTGRELLIETIHNLLDAMLKPMQAVRDAFGEIFTADNRANVIYNIVEAIHSFSKMLVLTDESAGKLKRTFKGLFALLDIVFSILGSGFSVVKTVITSVMKALGITSDTILDLTASIGDSIVALRDWIKEHNILATAIEFIVPIIVDMVNAVGKFFDELMAVPKVQNALTKLIDTITGLFDGVDWKNLLSGTPEDIVNGFIEGLKGAVSKVWVAVQELATAVVEAFCEKLEIHSPSVLFMHLAGFVVAGFLIGIKDSLPLILDTIGSIISELLIGIKDLLVKGIPVLVDTVTNLLISIKESFESLDIEWSKLFVVGTIIAVLALFRKVIKVFESFGKSALSVKDSVTGFFKGLTTAVSDIKDAKVKEIKVNNFKTIAEALLILAGAIGILSMIKQEDLIKAGVALAGLAVIMVALVKVLDGVSEDFSLAKISLFAVGLGAALLLMSIAMNNIAKIGDGGVQALNILLGLMVGIGAIVWAMGTFVKGETAQNMDKAGKVFTKMATALLIMSLVMRILGNMTIDNVWQGVLIMAYFATICGIMVAVSAAGGKHADKAGKMMSKMATAMLLMAVTMKIINTMTEPEMVKGLTVLLGFMVICGVMVAVTKLCGKHAVAAGAMMLMMASAFVILAGAIAVLSIIPEEGLKRAQNVLQQVGLMFSAFIVLTTVFGKRMISSGAMMLMMAGAMTALSIAIAVLSFISEDDIDKGISAIAKMGILMSVLVGVSKLAGEHAAKAGLMLMSASVAILVLAGAIALLSLLEPDDVVRGTACISALLLCLSALVAATGHAKQDLKTTLIILAAIIAELVASVALLSVLDQKAVQSATICISMLVGMFALLVASTKYAQTATVTLVTLTVIVAALAGIIALLALLPIESTLASTISLSVLLLSMAGVVAILSLIGPAATGAIAAAAAFDAVVLIIGGLFVAIGALMSYVPEMEQFLDKGIDVLVKIATGLGEALGGFVGGALSNICSGLPSLANDLAMFMVSLTPFLDGAKLIDGKMVDGIVSLAEMILILTAADILEGLTSWLTGGNSLTSFAEELIPFGKAMVDFSNTVSGKIDSDAVTSASNAGKTIAEMAATLPNEGGLAGWFLGENDMEKFGAQLVPFGQAMVEFSKTVAGNIDEGAVTAVANAGKIMTELADTVPNTGGLVGWFTGDNDLDTFGSKIKSFGESIVDFSKEVSGNIDEGAVTAAANAGAIMVKLQESIPEEGGWFDNKADLSDLGNDMEKFGNSLTRFDKSLGETDPDRITRFITPLDELTRVVKNMNGIKSEGASAFVSAMKDIESISFDTIFTTFNDVTAGSGSFETIVSVGSNIINSLVEGVTLSQNTLINTIKSIIDEVSSSIETKFSVIKNIGSGLINELIAGIEDKKPAAKTAVKYFMNETEGILKDVRDYYDDFNLAGEYLIEGFADGITDKTWYAEAKSREMAKSALQAARSELDINSPSREFYGVGAFAGQGFVNALDDYGNASYKAGSEMANKANTGLNNAISKLRNVIDSDIDAQPTIRPVLDLSDVTDGMNTVNSLFGMNPSLGLLADVNGISSMMSSRSQNGINDDVVKAIKDLKQEIGSYSGSTYNINGITYDDGSAVTEAIKTIVRAVKIERRV